MSKTSERFLLAIESSCDDTGAAVIGEYGTILSNVVASQDKDHKPFHGVVPEIASRAHVRDIADVCQKALDQANMTLKHMAGIAVTSGPGLIDSLLVGVNFAKGLAISSGLPLISVNHIRGHVRAIFLEHGTPPLPALALITSGGHSHLFSVDEQEELDLLVKTRDDAAGEAFDKLSKMLGLGFPGGPQIDRMAQSGDYRRFHFRQPKISDGSLDFSFSGYKTAALRHIESDPSAFKTQQNQSDLCASFQHALVRHLLDRVGIALNHGHWRSLLLGGGVACNSALRAQAAHLADSHQVPFFVSQPKLCTDNAAMIGAEGWAQFKRDKKAALSLAPEVKAKAYRQYTPLR